MIELLFPESPDRALLFDALRIELSAVGDRLLSVPDTDAAWRLRENECDTALVSPVVYALSEGEVSLVGDAVVSSVGGTREAMLVFRGGLGRISSLALPASGTIDAILAQIVLREKYDMQPVVTVVRAPWRDVLATHEAVLVTGEEAAALAVDSPSIDLGDEWYDMTQLPLVRGVVAGWNHRLTAPFSDAVRRAAAEADRAALAVLQVASDGHFAPDELHLIPPHRRFLLDDDARQALDSFFRLAFFHGLHRDIPTFHMWSPEREDDAA
jgi:predicted solute-binding protein